MICLSTRKLGQVAGYKTEGQQEREGQASEKRGRPYGGIIEKERERKREEGGARGMEEQPGWKWTVNERASPTQLLVKAPTSRSVQLSGPDSHGPPSLSGRVVVPLQLLCLSLSLTLSRPLSLPPSLRVHNPCITSSPGGAPPKESVDCLQRGHLFLTHRPGQPFRDGVNEGES